MCVIFVLVLFCVVARDVFVVFAACFDFASVFCFVLGRQRDGSPAGRFARGRFARRTVYPGEPVSGTVRMGRFARANRLARMIASALRFWLGAHAESRGKPCGSKTYCQKVVKSSVVEEVVSYTRKVWFGG